MSFRNDTNDDQLLIEVFRFNYETLKKVVNAINANAYFEMKSFRETKINYNLDVNSKGVCTVSLPYDEGFTVKVDGKKVEIKKVMDFMLGFDVEKGKHEIVITYMPRGFILGAILSGVGVLLLILMYINDKFKINKGK